eukprot:TRINITY_DN3292_c0_g1_i1.p1 TRINITY_DN3292_c0_g1~~TRINITY_DN3292_c0_g1_i1.p1  ORF type:complete len:156 (+),score=55.10 TRINITY_DN3292_c0_g1_i1:95-562(+)
MSEFSDHEGGDDGGFGEESYDGDDHQNQGQGGQETENVISNQHYDEVVQLSDDDGDDVATPEQSNVSASKGYADAHDDEDHDGGSEEHDGEEDDEEQDEDEHEDTTPAGRNAGPIQVFLFISFFFCYFSFGSILFLIHYDHFNSNVQFSCSLIHF